MCVAAPDGESTEHTTHRARQQLLWGCFRLDIDGSPAWKLRGLLKV